jgi:NAD(P)-dependent dehydrogenase (short-subunit alcohol dehydrogenase family)
VSGFVSGQVLYVAGGPRAQECEIMQVFHGIAELEKAVGAHLGYSGWHTVTQEQITLLADATGDHQWIHVDPESAAAGPFGRTVAHGFLTAAWFDRACPGVLRDNLHFKMSGDDWDTVLNVHLRGSFLMSRSAQKHMVDQRHGRIVNLSSSSALGNRARPTTPRPKPGCRASPRPSLSNSARSASPPTRWRPASSPPT